MFQVQFDSNQTLFGGKNEDIEYFYSTGPIVKWYHKIFSI